VVKYCKMLKFLKGRKRLMATDGWAQKEREIDIPSAYYRRKKNIDAWLLYRYSIVLYCIKMPASRYRYNTGGRKIIDVFYDTGNSNYT